MPEVASTCRICSGFCGLTVSVEEGRVSKVRGDRSHPFSRGFACSKGLRIPDGMNSPKRLLHPLKRRKDGTFEEISKDQALDEIGSRLRDILEESSGGSVALFGGTSMWFNATLIPMMGAFLKSIGSPNKYTTMTIDQSAHQVTALRMGSWEAGRQSFEDADVAMIIGSNPMVSLGAYGIVSTDPVKRIKDARSRGLKLIVVDPRRTETAAFADCFVQIIPGQDVTFAAGLIRLILQNGWQDEAFCTRYAGGLAELKEAVTPFTPDFVARHAGIPPETLDQVATMFARNARRGIAIIGTGSTMAPHSNLADHLVETLNVLCGRYLREGERVHTPGIFSPRREVRARVSPPTRPWELEPKLPSGHGQIYGEFPSALLADQMLRTDGRRVRALFVNGGNPAVCLPDQRKAVAGLRALDLLVTIDPYMTATAKLCHYIMPPTLALERHDVVVPPTPELLLAPLPFGQYLPPVCQPPPGSELIDDWELYWGLASRLDLALELAGQTMSPRDRPDPSGLEMLEIVLNGARVPFSVVRDHPGGYMHNVPEYVLPATEDDKTRFNLAPADIAAEIADVVAERQPDAPEGRPFRLISRRERAVLNSVDLHFMDPSEKGYEAFAYLNPEDLEELESSEGALAEIASDSGRIRAVMASDPALRRGVVSMTHCRGDLPDEGTDHHTGPSASWLVTTGADIEPINAMPVMSAIPVSVTPVLAGTDNLAV